MKSRSRPTIHDLHQTTSSSNLELSKNVTSSSLMSDKNKHKNGSNDKKRRPQTPSWTSEIFRQQSSDPAYPNPSRLDDSGKSIYQSPLDKEPIFSSVLPNKLYPGLHECLHCQRSLTIDYFPRACFSHLHPGGVMGHCGSFYSKAYYKTDNPPVKQPHKKLVCHECLSQIKTSKPSSKYLGEKCKPLKSTRIKNKTNYRSHNKEGEKLSIHTCSSSAVETSPIVKFDGTATIQSPAWHAKLLEEDEEEIGFRT